MAHPYQYSTSASCLDLNQARLAIRQLPDHRGMAASYWTIGWA